MFRPGKKRKEKTMDTNLNAQWNEVNDVYECGIWWSTDGDSWYDQSGEPAGGEPAGGEFEDTTIHFVGGPRDGEIVA
jgi:hypothetical protein